MEEPEDEVSQFERATFAPWSTSLAMSGGVAQTFIDSSAHSSLPQEPTPLGPSSSTAIN
jgi:hypothetical protein